MKRWHFFLIILLAMSISFTAHAQQDIEQRCQQAIQPRPANFELGGIILTAFDGASLWVYDIDQDTRYPLPETRPCLANCHLSPDASWITYLNADTGIFSMMRLDGTQRAPLSAGAAFDVQWWSQDRILVWTPDHRTYLRSLDDLDVEESREYLPAEGILAIQPNGYYALALLADSQGQLRRALINLADEEQSPVFLAPDVPYFNGATWSSSGSYLAYVGRGALDTSLDVAGAEIYLIQPGSAIPRQLTYFSSQYGAVRIDGYVPNSLSWSPDSTRIAFWVIELIGPDYEANTGTAELHVLDINTGQMVAYCGFVTNEHTPNPSRIVWSPDGSHLALAGNVPGDDKGYLLLALDLETGVFTELSNGIFPALGRPDVVAWGNKP
ncbi:MAG: hypothetical protein KC546_12025 [Anaerolineae bacterium]|nr:hypothetical protein [Anaerolineae bacterium]